jgi:hypothetical protein
MITNEPLPANNKAVFTTVLPALVFRLDEFRNAIACNFTVRILNDFTAAQRHEEGDCPRFWDAGSQSILMGKAKEPEL